VYRYEVSRVAFRVSVSCLVFRVSRFVLSLRQYRDFDKQRYCIFNLKRQTVSRFHGFNVSRRMTVTLTNNEPSSF
jgi:hypothetical protein